MYSSVPAALPLQVLDKHFGQVCELDIMNSPDTVSSSMLGLVEGFRLIDKDLCTRYISLFLFLQSCAVRAWLGSKIGLVAATTMNIRKPQCPMLSTNRQ